VVTIVADAAPGSPRQAGLGSAQGRAANPGWQGTDHRGRAPREI